MGLRCMRCHRRRGWFEAALKQLAQSRGYIYRHRRQGQRGRKGMLGCLCTEQHSLRQYLRGCQNILRMREWVGGNSLIPVGCTRGVWATVPVGAAPQTSRAAIGAAEAMEMTLKAAKTVLENEQCILKVVGVDRLKLR
jgi:hypothetical protein